MGKMEAGNILLIITGIALVLSGPYIGYRTVFGVVTRRKQDPSAKLHVFSNGLNLVIAVLFFFAGLLFVWNNLKGNPLG